MLEWMNWTPVTAWFFIAIGLMLVGMTVWQLALPTVERRGLLRIPTTRGDRFFIGLLGAAFIHLAWIGLTNLDLTWAVAISVAWMIGVLTLG
jgi:predicted small integral membrane protein